MMMVMVMKCLPYVLKDTWYRATTTTMTTTTTTSKASTFISINSASLGRQWVVIDWNILLHESLTSFFLLSKWTFYRLARKLWHFDFGKQKSRKDGENAKSLFESENCRKLRRIGCDTNAAKATTHTALAEGKGYEGKSEFIICNNLDETTRCTASGQAAHKLLTEN